MTKEKSQGKAARGKGAVRLVAGHEEKLEQERRQEE